jgi:hypothetical protein
MDEAPAAFAFSCLGFLNSRLPFRLAIGCILTRSARGPAPQSGGRALLSVSETARSLAVGDWPEAPDRLLRRNGQGSEWCGEGRHRT